MKFLIPSVMIVLLGLQLGFSASEKKGDDNFCAKLRDGKLIMLHDGQVMTADVILENGTQVHPDGSITKQDGETIVLKDGECISKKGRVEDGHPKIRTIFENGKFLPDRAKKFPRKKQKHTSALGQNNWHTD